MVKIIKTFKVYRFYVLGIKNYQSILEEEVLMKHSMSDSVFHNTALATPGQLKRNQDEQ